MNGSCQKFEKLSGGLDSDVSLPCMVSTIPIISVSQMGKVLTDFPITGVSALACLVPLPSVGSIAVLCSGARQPDPTLPSWSRLY